MRNYSSKYKKNVKEKYRVNDKIRAKTVRLVEDGEMLGEIPTEEALAKAKEKGLDLVEVAPNQKPPVCKILSYSKLKYEESKKERKARAKGKSKGLKEMQFPTTIDVGDIEHKMRRVKEFLDKGHKVKLTIYFKGRGGRERADELAETLLTQVKEISTIDQTFKKRGRRWYVILAPA